MSHQSPIHERIQRALQSDVPFESLRRLAVDLVNEGRSTDEVLQSFEDYRATGAPDETIEDVVLDVMDLLVGWCRPEIRIPQQNTTQP